MANPDQGYPDFQRQVAWDGPSILNEQAVAHVGPQTYGPFYLARWASLGGAIRVTGNPVLITFTWWADQAATIQIAQRVFMVDSIITKPMALLLRQLGPVVTITVAPIGAGTPFTMTAILFGTNRQETLEVMPPGPYIMLASVAGLLTTDTLALTPNGYHHGPSQLLLEAAPGGARFRLQGGVAAGSYDDVTYWVLAPNTQQNYTVVIPGGAWRILVDSVTVNGTTVIAKCWPSYSGAT